MKKIIIASLVLFAPFLASADTLSPTITLYGGSVTVVPGSSYSEPGYSASDPTDGDITSSVNVNNGVNASQPGSYNVDYSVIDSLGLSDFESRSVNVLGWGGISNPCLSNGTCPCPISADPITGNPAAWKACAVANYPKLSDGSTLVCRLQALMPGETKTKCAADQGGFQEMFIYPNGMESNI